MFNYFDNFVDTSLIFKIKLIYLWIFTLAELHPYFIIVDLEFEFEPCHLGFIYRMRVKMVLTRHDGKSLVSNLMKEIVEMLLEWIEVSWMRLTIEVNIILGNFFVFRRINIFPISWDIVGKRRKISGTQKI